MTFQGCNCNLLLVTGEYSCLTVDLTFKREFSYYLLTIYVPCCMLVIVSWVNTPLLFSRRGLTFEGTNQTARWASGWTPTQCLLESLLESPPCSPCPHSRFLTLFIIITLPTQQLSSCTSFSSEWTKMWEQSFNVKMFFFLGWETSAAREELPLIWIYLQASSVWWEIPTQKSWKDFLAPSQYEPSIVFSLHFFSTFLLLP